MHTATLSSVWLAPGCPPGVNRAGDGAVSVTVRLRERVAAPPDTPTMGEEKCVAALGENAEAAAPLAIVACYTNTRVHR